MIVFFTKENNIFLVGGDRSNQVQSINFDGVTDLTQAKQKEWVMLGSLTYSVYQAGVQFYDNKLFVISSSDSSFRDVIQCFELSTNTTQISGV